MAQVSVADSTNALTYALLFQVAPGLPNITSVSPTSITGTQGDFIITYEGSFVIQNGVVQIGTITAVTFGDVVDPLAVRITGVSVDILDLATSSSFEAFGLFFDGNDTITSALTTDKGYSGRDGNDRFLLGPANDEVFGGDGIDTFVVNASINDVQLDNRGVSDTFGRTLRVDGGFGEDLLFDVEILEFTNGRFAVQLGDGTSLNGRDDTINGDTIGNITRDIIFGEEGNDRIIGGTDNDRLFGNEGRDTIFGGTGVDLIYGGSEDDTLNGQKGRDTLFGGSGADVMRGGTGNDVLLGQSANDEIDGGAGADTLNGGTGRDVLIGRKGNDTLTGGGKRDEFHFRKGDGTDTITDFKVGVDLIKIISGANRLGQITFDQEGTDVRLSFANVEVLIEDTTVAQMQDADNFSFV